MPSSLRIGTSGWNYPSGRGTWNGVFYPSPRQRNKGFDELTFYAEHFDTVEVNSTFYGSPRAAVCRRWADRTPPGFEFSIKLHQRFTHADTFDKVPGAELDEFRAGIEPLAARQKMGALLAQFPPRFKDTPQSRDYLADLVRAFAGYPIAVELRHRSWSDGIGETLSLLNAFGAAWVQIDEPKFRFSIRQNYLPNVQGFYYMRLHGRNAKHWWTHEKAEDRYDYLYSAGELQEFIDTAGAVRQLVKKLYLYTNNHFAAKSVANAAMIKKALGEPIEGDYPPEFVARYPGLAGVASACGPRARVATPSRTLF